MSEGEELEGVGLGREGQITSKIVGRHLGTVPIVEALRLKLHLKSIRITTMKA